MTLVQHSVKFIHIVIRGKSSFILVAEYATIYPFLYPFHPFIYVHLDYFCVWTFMNTAPMTILACLLMNMCTNSKGQRVVFRFCRYCSAVANVCSQLHSHQQLPYILTISWCCLSFHYWSPAGYVVVSHCSCIPWLIKLSSFPWAQDYPLLRRVCSIIFASILMGWLVFFVFLCVSQIKNICQIPVIASLDEVFIGCLSPPCKSQYIRDCCVHQCISWT